MPRDVFIYTERNESFYFFSFLTLFFTIKTFKLLILHFYIESVII